MKLYHYEHCPYCAKARMIFGLKDVPFKLIPLPNDDEQTPTQLIGKKMVPILIKNDNTPMPESLDIIKFIDENFGDSKIVSYTAPKDEIAQWLQNARSFGYHLAMPRWVQMPLPEFLNESSRRYFQNKKEKQSIGSFAEAYAKTDHYQKLAEDALVELESLMISSDRFYDLEPGQIHIDDFHLFASLRNLTTVANLQWPKNIINYVQELSKRSKVDLYTEMSI